MEVASRWGQRVFTYLLEVLEAPPLLVDVVATLLSEAAQVGHCSTGQCSVAVPAFQDADELAVGVALGKCTGVLGEPVIKTRWNFAAVAGHRGVLVLACVEAAAIMHISRMPLDNY